MIVFYKFPCFSIENKKKILKSRMEIHDRYFLSFSVPRACGRADGGF